MGVIYIYKTLIWDLKMGGGIGRAVVLGGRRYWEGGSIGRGGIGGTAVFVFLWLILRKNSHQGRKKIYVKFDPSFIIRLKKYRLRF